MTAALFVGVDVGTTSVKCVAFDRHGGERGSAAAPTPWVARRGGVETTGDDLVGTALSVVADACAGTDSVAAIGITGMAESGVLLDSTGAATSPVLRWDDPRTDDTADALYGRIGPAAFSERTGLPPTGRTTLAKLHWETTVGGCGGVSWLGVPELLAHRLGAARVSERSLASRTGGYDVLADVWLPEHLDAAGLAGLRLPDLCSAGDVVGRVRSDAPVAPGAALVVAGHDHVCAAVGAGVPGDDWVGDSMGTGEALVRAVDLSAVEPTLVTRLVADGMTVGRHVLPGRLAVSRGLGSGLILRRALHLVGLAEHPAAGPERRALDEAAREVAHPPSLAADAEWTVTGLRPEVVWRAALDLVARRAAEGLAALDTLLGPHAGVVACGGWLRSAVVRETKAAAIGPYEWASMAEPGAFGAAVLAARALGEPIGTAPHRTLISPTVPEEHTP
jgi:sugar (pentulose or hexulose) kinase